ncbi:MAG: imidazole glycerol phosphate synthase cyclase subunit [Candidatus Omnitrophota bacterium]|nr:imidazole glycerol phosphate synthase cyclase subunit [Candidatus Omnitrophota bacterium]
MLKKRLITVLTFADGVLFRTKDFNPDYRYTANFVDAWSIDEIVVLDITRPGRGDRENFYHEVSRFAEQCFVPLAAGGGVRSIEDFKTFLKLGADKVVVNSEALRRPEFITQAAKLYGTQCVVVSMDVKKNLNGSYEVYKDFGTQPTGLSPVTWAQKAQHLGAGEILVTSIEKDGSLEGYDNELNRLVSEAVKVPVLVNGGAGKWQDFVDGFEMGKAAGVCTTNIYHFTESSITSAKIYLKDNGIQIR